MSAIPRYQGILASAPDIVDFHWTEVCKASDVSQLEQENAHAQIELALSQARLRGMSDFLSGQPKDMPFDGTEVSAAKNSSLNFAWTVGYEAAQDSELFKLMVSRADRAMNTSDSLGRENAELRQALELWQRWFSMEPPFNDPAKSGDGWDAYVTARQAALGAATDATRVTLADPSMSPAEPIRYHLKTRLTPPIGVSSAPAVPAPEEAK